MADEGDDFVEGTEGGDSSSENPAIIVDGETYSVEAVKNLIDSESNFEKDYTRKTQALARDVEAMKESRDSVETDRLKNQTARDAINRDVRNVSDLLTGDPGKVREYKWEYDSVMGYIPPQEPNTPTAQSTQTNSKFLETIDALTKRLDNIEISNAGDSADALISFAEELVKKKYPYADMASVKDALIVEFKATKRLPSREKATEVVRKKHQFVVSKMPTPEVTENKDLYVFPSSKGAGTPRERAEELPSIDDSEAVLKHARGFLVHKQAEREAGAG